MKPRYTKLLPRKRRMKETKNNGQIPFDNNPRFSGLINYASNGVVDMYSAFQYGFKVGWQTCWHEQNESNKGMKEKILNYRRRFEDGWHCFYEYEFPFGKERLVRKCRTAEQAMSFEFELEVRKKLNEPNL